ncbi:MAG: Uma2 family endonuclease [Spirulinaceae cyanobacterium]
MGQDVDPTVTIPFVNRWSEEPPLESTLHLNQLILLLNCLNWLWQDRDDYFAAGNLTVFYSANQSKSEDFRGPDFFVVLGTEKRPRRSWTVWEENGQYPHVIVELLSDSTAKTDRGLKKNIYQNTFRTPEYFWFDPETLEFQGFCLISGRYDPVQPTAQGWLWSQQLKLYLGVQDRQLRFFTAAGELVPTPEEAAAAERQRAETQQQLAAAQQQRAETQQQRADTEQQRAETQQQRADTAEQQNAKLVEKLRALGVDPDTLI